VRSAEAPPSPDGTSEPRPAASQAPTGAQPADGTPQAGPAASQATTPNRPVDSAADLAVPPTITDPALRRFLGIIVAVMTAVVVAVSAAAFYTSYWAIYHYAWRSLPEARGHAWMAPLLVDAFIFVGACADIWLSLTTPKVTGNSRAANLRRLERLAPKLLLIAADTASFVLNVAHAPPTFHARAVAALAPTALLITFQMLIFVARRAARLRLARLEAQADTAKPPESPGKQPSHDSGDRAAASPPSRPRRAPTRPRATAGSSPRRRPLNGRVSEAEQLAREVFEVREVDGGQRLTAQDLVDAVAAQVPLSITQAQQFLVAFRAKPRARA
jgi:hypothetical protein